MENLIEINLTHLKPKGTLAQQITKAMGYEKINLNVIEIEIRIDAAIYCGINRALDLARIAKTIRKERTIIVCAWHKPKQVWWDGEEWNNSDIPPGIQTHSMCPECYEKEMKQVKILLEQEKILKEIEK